jgi:hypothetical protein
METIHDTAVHTPSKPIKQTLSRPRTSSNSIPPHPFPHCLECHPSHTAHHPPSCQSTKPTPTPHDLIPTVTETMQYELLLLLRPTRDYEGCNRLGVQTPHARTARAPVTPRRVAESGGILLSTPKLYGESLPRGSFTPIGEATTTLAGRRDVTLSPPDVPGRGILPHDPALRIRARTPGLRPSGRMIAALLSDASHCYPSTEERGRSGRRKEPAKRSGCSHLGRGVTRKRSRPVEG